MSTAITLANSNASTNDVVGVFFFECYPPAGTTQAVFTVNMPSTQLTDTSNYCRLSADAEYESSPRQGYVHLPAVSGDGLWHGSPGQVAPQLTVQWDANNPATLLRLSFANGPNGQGNACGWNSISVIFS